MKTKLYRLFGNYSLTIFYLLIMMLILSTCFESNKSNKIKVQVYFYDNNKFILELNESDIENIRNGDILFNENSRNKINSLEAIAAGGYYFKFIHKRFESRVNIYSNYTAVIENKCPYYLYNISSKSLFNMDSYLGCPIYKNGNKCSEDYLNFRISLSP